MSKTDMGTNSLSDEQWNIMREEMLNSLVEGQLRSLARVCEIGVEEGWDCRFSERRTAGNGDPRN